MQTIDLVGKQLGEFRIIERIGRGGMATVYRAHQASVNRDVALKILPLDDTFDDQNFPQRFALEAEVIAKLEHIHILPVYGYGIQDGVAYIAMRLLRGGSLADQMKEGALSLERCVDLFSQIAQGLAYAHSKGIIHRDLKPGNILLDEVGHPYLTDFGLAKLIHTEAHMTKTGNIVGTPAYMSPEQLRGEVLDHRTDIYSLGVILYQMLTGKRPFDGDSSDVVSIIYKHLEKAPQRPTEHNPLIPVDVERIVMQALEKKPEDRFATVGDMAAKLQLATGIRSTSSFPLPSSNLVSSTQVRRKRFTRRQQYAGGIFAAIMIVLLAALVIVPRLNQPEVFKLPTIVQNQKGTQTNTVPTADEIDTALRNVGSNGFLAIVACNLSSEYHVTVTREMTDFAHEYNLPTKVYNPDNDAYLQTTMIENARLEGAKAFVICPLDSTILTASLKSLDDANFPLVLPSSAERDLSYGGVIVNTDNYLMGVLPGQTGGQFIRDNLGGEARVVILDYPDLDHIVKRADGLEAGIKEFAPRATIVGRYIGGTRELAKASIAQLIADGVEFDMIASINDAGSYGAIMAMEEAGIDPASVTIVSVDAEQQAQEFISRDYFIRASVSLPRTDYARSAVGLIIRQLAGATLPQTIILAPGEVVTRKTIEQK